MKKILMIALCLLAILPTHADAKSYQVNWDCEDKQKLDEDTFYKTCHIVVTSDFDINHVTGELILKNATLQNVSPNGDWTNNNGYGTTVDFTSTTGHSGTFTVADLIFTGDIHVEECETSFAPGTIEHNEPTKLTCTVVDNNYYDSMGNIVTAEKYFEDCFNYVCTVVDNQYYFNSNGKSVSYDEFLNDCSSTEYIPNTPETGINYGLIMLPLGILAIVGITKYTKKNTKIYKI